MCCLSTRAHTYTHSSSKLLDSFFFLQSLQNRFFFKKTGEVKDSVIFFCFFTSQESKTQPPPLPSNLPPPPLPSNPPPTLRPPLPSLSAHPQTLRLEPRAL